MASLLTRIPVQRLILIAAGTLVSYFLIPVILSRYSQCRSVDETRLIRAVKFGDQNDEFNKKVNGIATLMLMFNSHNQRMKASGIELKEAQKELGKDYRERYLELDATAWWWASDFVREADSLKLLSPDEINELDADVKTYNQSVLTTVNAIKPLWHLLDSPGYKPDEQSQKTIEGMDATMKKEFDREYHIRNDVVKKISALCARSTFRTRWYDLLGL